MEQDLSPQDFYDDLQVMFNNAQVYNEKGSEIYVMSQKLKKFADKEMESFLVAEKVKSGPCKTRNKDQLPVSLP